MIRLYGQAQTRAFRVLWLLEELGVPYEHVKGANPAELRSPEFLKMNPNGRVPVLVDGELVLFESLAINLYLAERYGAESLWPKTPGERAQAVQWSFWAVTECERVAFASLFHSTTPAFEFWRGWVRSAHYAETHPAEAMPGAAETRAGLAIPLRALESHLDGRTSLVGGEFSVADLNVAAVLTLLRQGKVSLAEFPNVAAWLARSLSRPALARATAK